MKKSSLYLFLLLFAITLFLGYSSNVSAATYDATSYTAQLYDNYGPTLYTVTTEFSNMSWRGTIPSMTANTSGAAWGISSPIPLLANHTYSMTVKIEGNYGGNITLSTYNRIGVGTSLSNAKSSYENNTNCTLNYSNSIASNMTLQFAFTPSINSNYIVFPFATTYTGSNQSFYLYDFIIDDLGSGGVSQTDINNSLNNQTNELNNSITNSTNTITGAISETENNINLNIDDMEQSIVDSNKETQEVIKDQFNSCRDSKNLINQNNLTIGYISNDGVLHTGGDSSYTTDIISLSIGNYYLSGATLEKICYYNNGSFISCLTTKIPNFSVDNTFNGVRFQFTSKSLNGKLMLNEGSTALDYEPYGEQICTNKLDEANETSKGILGTIKTMLSYLNPFSENFFAYKLVELIVDGLKDLFVPSKEELQSLIDEFTETMETKLGAIYQVSDMLISILKSIFVPSSRNSCITFPEILDPMFNKKIISQIDYCFDSLRTDFSFLFTISDMIISIVCTLSFANMLYKKFEGFIGGDTSDY
ncbi:MAG: hypothetical protein ACI4WU_03650 [Bacilli bacterium]